jgi:hypothetical protein
MAKSAILYLRPIGLKLLPLKQTARSDEVASMKGMLDEQCSNESHPRDYLGRPHGSSSNRKDDQWHRVSQSLAIR